ncbi:MULTISPECIES: SDR family oxidoreductase [Ramlibacter]|uniref:SDR family oxidoreductase n=1 Tax=Ramlibacter aquaticus TaxID=2780094 RepID=A0ABR9SIB6_9BURK|nr:MULTISPECIES: SDR family oxidoreductase [Ramlibacter]MBE7942106.1 SDR family oxidoreductase [Ramlibacter aquaticus]
MDLHIAGRKAIVCASSQGLGHACARSLSREGVQVFINGRDATRLEAAAALIRAETGQPVVPVVADITTEAGRARLVAACPDADILVTNNAGPTPGRFEDWDHDAYLAVFEQNMLPAVLLIRALLAGMRQRQFGRVVNITSAMVKSPNPHQGLSTAARTALTAVCKAISREVAVDNVTINNLLPERIDTGRQQYLIERQARIDNSSLEAARAKLVDTIAAKRFGRPEEFGDMCAYLCSAQASYISGQNIQLDGGSYRGIV